MASSFSLLSLYIGKKERKASKPVKPAMKGAAQIGAAQKSSGDSVTLF
jgi:hypothetical protein